jgi:hypothetical protein
LIIAYVNEAMVEYADGGHEIRFPMTTNVAIAAAA